MADNIQVTPGSGTTVAADACTVNSVAGVLVPLGKNGFGGNDVWTYVTSTVGMPGNLVQVGGSAFALGQQLAAASLPVVLTAAQITTLTPPTTVAVTGTFFQATQPVSFAPATTGGLSTYSTISAASTNPVNVKASPGQVYGYSAYNTTGTAIFVHVYDSATAPTAGTGTPVRRLMVPANGGIERTIPTGIQFSAGIGFTITGAATDADATAVAAGAVLLNIDYK